MADGGRASTYLRQRLKERMALEVKKQERLEKDKSDPKPNLISQKFQSTIQTTQQGSTSTYGLLTLEEMKAYQKEAEIKRGQDLQPQQKKGEQKKRKKAKKKANLSFDLEEDDDDADDANNELKKRRLGKNPQVDTSFLPDREREEQEAAERERLRREYIELQEQMKQEDIEVVFDYWDGSGHRHELTMKKGDSIGKFLAKCLSTLKPQFYELERRTADELMFVKENSILPHHLSFYDFIASKAVGKTGGPLHTFDVSDSVISQLKAGLPESRIGRVVLRSWYEKNKHIWPASQWEHFEINRS